MYWHRVSLAFFLLTIVTTRADFDCIRTVFLRRTWIAVQPVCAGGAASEEPVRRITLAVLDTHARTRTQMRQFSIRSIA
jgi:hypothetical protein